MSGKKKVAGVETSPLKKYIVKTKMCCGYVNTSFSRGAVLVVDEEKKTFTEESSGRAYTDIRDIIIAVRNGLVVPWTAAVAKEMAEIADPSAPRPRPAKTEKPPMNIIKSDDDMNRTIDIRHTKKQPEPEKVAGPLTVVRETHNEAMRGMSVVRQGEESEGLGTPIGAAPTKKGAGVTVGGSTEPVPESHAGKFKAVDAKAAARAAAAKEARLKQVAKGEKLVQPA